MTSQQENSQWKVWAGCGAAALFVAAGWFYLGPCIWAGDIQSQPQARSEPLATVQILHEPLNPSFFPLHNKLLIGAKHQMVARGQPFNDASNYIWWYGLEASFDPNNTPKNCASGHRTIYGGSGTMSEGSPKVLVQYLLDDWPTDERPLTITQPSGFSTQHGNISTGKTDLWVRKDLTFAVMNESIVYDVRDQTGSPISRSDRGDANGTCRITCREDVPWDSDIPGVVAGYLSTIPTIKNWGAWTDLEGKGSLTDILRIPRMPAKYLSDSSVVGKDLVRVNTHDWHVGVAESGSESAPFWQKKFTQNVVNARVTAWREEGSFIVISFTVDYTISVQ
jgi:hypothetical protein